MAGLRTILLLIGAAGGAGIWWWSTRRPAATPRPRAEPRLGAASGDPRPETPRDAKGRAADHPEFDPDTTAPRALDRDAAGALRRADADAARIVASAPPPSGDFAAAFADAPTAVSVEASAEARIERGEPGPGFDPSRDMILSLFVVPAAGETFLGAEVVETLTGAQLQFGKRQVFHRHAPDGRSMYCVANMVEPGTLAPDAIRFEHVPGLLFFAVLPGPRSGTDTFADMIATARRVAQRLRGELADAERSSLTPQTIQHLRERVVEFERLRSRTEG